MQLRPVCPTCDYSLEREEGYWVGAMIVNLGVAQTAFFAFFIGGIVLGWPDPPWTLLLVGGLAIMALLPIVFYPLSKTIWAGIDLAAHPLSDEGVRETD